MPDKTPVSELPKGYTFPESAVAVNGVPVQLYLHTVGDTSNVYFSEGLAPPLAVVAWSFREVQRYFSLPPGTVHARQQIETHGGVPILEDSKTVSVVGRVVGRTGKNGLVITTLDFEVTVPPSSEVRLRGRTTLAVLGDSAAVGEGSGQKSGSSLKSDLVMVTKTIDRETIRDYANVSGDSNPIHLDESFARTTPFGGIIAHGMLTLASVQEMMVKNFGVAWLTSGKLDARFRGPTRAGDKVTTGATRGSEGVYDFECQNQSSVVLISGVAEVPESFGK